MKLVHPELAIGQGFGLNLDGAYKAQGLSGHPGIDFGGNSDYGKPVICAVEGAVVSSLLSKDKPNLSAYRAVNTIYEDETGCYEIQYGHDMLEEVKIGDVLHLGQEIATIGNTGDVYTGTPAVLVPEVLKEAGSHAGAHLHLQVRLIGKEAATGQLQPHRAYLNDGSGILTLNGFHYYQLYPSNGYASCVNPEDFFQVAVVQDNLPDTIKEEVQTLNTESDPAIRDTFIQLIIKQIRKMLGY